MISSRAPRISVGQLYLNTRLNEYLIVTKNTYGQIYYAGPGFRGHCQSESFLENFEPVNPNDLEPSEIRELLELAPAGTIPRIGFIQEEQ